MPIFLAVEQKCIKIIHRIKRDFIAILINEWFVGAQNGINQMKTKFNFLYFYMQWKLKSLKHVFNGEAFMRNGKIEKRDLYANY